MQLRCGAARRTIISAIAVIVFIAFAHRPAHADYSDGWRAFQRGEYTTAVDLWRESAWREGDLYAQKQLGEVYRDGKFAPRDEIEAYVWYYLALINPSSSGQTEQGSIANLALQKQVAVNLDRLAFFMSVEQKEEARRRIVYVLASRGAEGFFRLGELYDPDDHHRRCEKSTTPLNDANNKYPNWWVYCQLHPYLPGFNVIPKSNLDALAFYTLAARLGHPIARLALTSVRQYIQAKFVDGSGYYDMIPEMKSDPKSLSLLELVQARKRFANQIFARAETAANRWQPPFELYPGGYSDESKGIFERQEALKRIDKLNWSYIQEALKFLTFYEGPIDNSCGPTTRKAMATYQASLGVATTGDLTPEQKVRLIKEVADRGYANAQTALGTMYFHGIGEPVNYARARYWFEKASNQMEPYAFFNLGVIYRDGLGVPIDRNQAATYFMSAKRILQGRHGVQSAEVQTINRELKALGWSDE